MAFLTLLSVAACGGSDDPGPPEGIGCAGSRSVQSSAGRSFRVVDVAVDSDRSRLWLGTEAGAVGVDLATRDTIVFTSQNSGLANDQVAAVALDADGDPWFGFGEARCGNDYCGVSHYRAADDDWTTYAEGDSHLVDGRFYTLTLSVSNEIWGGTTAGAAYFRSGRWYSYFDFHDCSRPGSDCTPLWSYRVEDLAFAGDGSAWLAIGAMVVGVQPKPGGVARLSSANLTDTWDMDDGLPNNRASRIALVGDRPWVVSQGVVARIGPDSNRFETVGEWSTHPAHDIAVDGQGDVWVATNGGVHRYAAGTGEWSSWGSEQCLLSQSVNTLLTFDSTICFGTDSGIGCYDSASVKWTFPHWSE